MQVDGKVMESKVRKEQNKPPHLGIKFSLLHTNSTLFRDSGVTGIPHRMSRGIPDRIPRGIPNSIPRGIPNRIPGGIEPHGL